MPLIVAVEGKKQYENFVDSKLASLHLCAGSQSLLVWECHRVGCGGPHARTRQVVVARQATLRCSIRRKLVYDFRLSGQE